MENGRRGAGNRGERRRRTGNWGRGRCGGEGRGRCERGKEERRRRAGNWGRGRCRGEIGERRRGKGEM